MFKNIFLYLFLALISLNVYPSIGEAGFIRDISQADKWELDEIFNQLKGSREGKYFSLMESIFQKPSEYVSSNNTAIAKIHSADILVQGYRNRRYENENLLEDIYSYAKGLAKSDNSIVSQISIFIVGYYDRKDGFALLMDILSKGDRMTASASALAASSMCDSFQEQKFEDAVNQVSSDKLRDLVKEQGYVHREALLSTSWCDQRRLPQ